MNQLFFKYVTLKSLRCLVKKRARNNETEKGLVLINSFTDIDWL